MLLVYNAAKQVHIVQIKERVSFSHTLTHDLLLLTDKLFSTWQQSSAQLPR